MQAQCFKVPAGSFHSQRVDSAKYLGIVLNRRLRWHEQVEAAVAKGTATMLAVSRLSRPTFGLPHKYLRQLYRSVVLPPVEYGLVVWYELIRVIHENGRHKGSVGFSKQLAKVQRLAGRVITGAFHTTVTDVSTIMLPYRSYNFI